MVQRQAFSEFDTDMLFDEHAVALLRENQLLRNRRTLALVLLAPLLFVIALPVVVLFSFLTIGSEAMMSLPLLWHGLHTHFSKPAPRWHDNAWPLLRVLPTIWRVEHVDTLLILLGELLPETHLDVQTFLRDVQDHLTRRLRLLTTYEAQQLSEPARKALALVVQRRATGKSASAELVVISLLTLAALTDKQAIRAARRLERGHYDERVREAATEYLRAVL